MILFDGHKYCVSWFNEVVRGMSSWWEDKFHSNNFLAIFESDSTVFHRFTIRTYSITVADGEEYLSDILSARCSVGRWKSKRVITNLCHWHQRNTGCQKRSIVLQFLAIWAARHQKMFNLRERNSSKICVFVKCHFYLWLRGFLLLLSSTTNICAI